MEAPPDFWQHPNIYLNILWQILHGYELSTRAGQREATNSSADIKVTLGWEGALRETHHLKPRTKSIGFVFQRLEGDQVPNVNDDVS